MTEKIKAKDRKNYRPCERCDEPVHVDLSQCSKCRHFNVEKKYDPKDDGTILLRDITEEKSQRIQTGPWDPVWGTTTEDNGTPEGRKIHGMVNSSVTLLGGEPGAGKSTLSIHLADSIAGSTKREVLYVSKEEPDGQVQARYKRLKLTNAHLIRMQPINKEADLSAILLHYKPVAVFIDSFKKVAPDPVDQVAFASRLKEYCVELAAIGIIIDHVNKDEDFSGLMANQHEVDTTIKFRKIANSAPLGQEPVRELTSIKNRNGAAGISVLFRMTETGLVYMPEEEFEEFDDEEEEEDEND